MTKPVKLLNAVVRLAEAGKAEFSLEDLVAKAFELFPNDFNLRGYPTYPDSNPIYVSVMGKSAALIVKGWIEKTGTKKFRVTAKGLSDFAAMAGNEGENDAKIALSREIEEGIGSLFLSISFNKFIKDLKDEITFYHFCRFASLSARDTWQKVKGKLNKTEFFVKEAVTQGEAGHDVRAHVQGRNIQITSDELLVIGALWTFMKEKFRSDIEEWKKNI